MLNRIFLVNCTFCLRSRITLFWSNINFTCWVIWYIFRGSGLFLILHSFIRRIYWLWYLYPILFIIGSSNLYDKYILIIWVNFVINISNIIHHQDCYSIVIILLSIVLGYDGYGLVEAKLLFLIAGHILYPYSSSQTIFGLFNIVLQIHLNYSTFNYH